MIAKQTLGHKRLSFFMLIDNYCNQICKVECATALSMKESKIIKLFCQFHIFLTACMRHAAVLHFSFVQVSIYLEFAYLLHISPLQSKSK